MDRRSFVVAAAAFIAGCGGTTDDGDEPTSRTGTTDAPTFTTPSASPSPTPRPGAVKAAIEESRSQLADALGAIEAAEVIEDDGPGIYSEDGSPGYSEGLSAAKERTVAARERLEAVSSDTTGEKAATVERLLRLSLYLRAKRFVHRGLLNAFIDYELGVGSLQQRPGEAAGTLQQGAERFGRANELRARARARLEEVRETKGAGRRRRVRTADRARRTEGRRTHRRSVPSLGGGVRHLRVDITVAVPSRGASPRRWESRGRTFGLPGGCVQRGGGRSLAPNGRPARYRDGRRAPGVRLSPVGA